MYFRLSCVNGGSYVMCDVAHECSVEQWIYRQSFKLMIKQIIEKPSFEFGRCGDGNYISQTTRGDGNYFSSRGYFSVVIWTHTIQTTWILRFLRIPIECCLLLSKSIQRCKDLKIRILLLFVVKLLLRIIECQLIWTERLQTNLDQ